MKRKPLVRTLLIAQHHQILLKWQENKNRIIGLFESMPDFQFQIDWECDSKFIPFVKSFAPNESYFLYKRGGYLRIDMSLVGWSKIQSLKGKVSLIINGKGPREGEILIVDNITQAISNLLTDVNLTQLDQEVDDLIAQEQYASEIKAENISLNIAKTWRGEPITQKIENYVGKKYNMKGTFHLLLSSFPWINQFDASKIPDFARYSTFYRQNQVWLKDKDLIEKVQKQNNVLTQSIVDYMECNPDTLKLLFGDNYEKTMKLKSSMTPEKDRFLKLQVLEKSVSKQYKKSITGTLWICENFPLNFEQILPILDILASANPKATRIREFFEKKNLIPSNCFPLKAMIPIFLSVNAIISFRKFEFKKADINLFDIRHLSKKLMIPSKDQGISSCERVKTEGFMDDYESPLKCKKHWDDWFNDKDKKSKEDKADSYLNDNYIEEEEENEQNVSKIKHFAKSFFSKESKSNAVNSDYVNIFEEGDHKVKEIDQSSEFSEKSRHEMLMVNDHPTYTPKTISYIEEKISQDPSNRIYTGIENQSGLRISHMSPGKMIQTEYGSRFKLRNHLGPEIPLFDSTSKPKVTGDIGESFDKSYEELSPANTNSHVQQLKKAVQNNTNTQNLTRRPFNYNQGAL